MVFQELYNKLLIIESKTPTIQTKEELKALIGKEDFYGKFNYTDYQKITALIDKIMTKQKEMVIKLLYEKIMGTTYIDGWGEQLPYEEMFKTIRECMEYYLYDYISFETLNEVLTIRTDDKQSFKMEIEFSCIANMGINGILKTPCFMKVIENGTYKFYINGTKLNFNSQIYDYILSDDIYYVNTLDTLYSINKNGDILWELQHESKYDKILEDHFYQNFIYLSTSDNRFNPKLSIDRKSGIIQTSTAHSIYYSNNCRIDTNDYKNLYIDRYKISFKYSIKDVKSLGDNFVVLLDNAYEGIGLKPLPYNICCISPYGDMLWNIKDIICEIDDNHFISLSIEEGPDHINDRYIMVVISQNKVCYKINPGRRNDPIRAKFAL